MGKATGFMEHGRETATRRPVIERVNDWFEIYQDFPDEKRTLHGLRRTVLSHRLSGKQPHP